MRKIQIKKRSALALARAQLFSNSWRRLRLLAGKQVPAVVLTLTWTPILAEFLLTILLYGYFILFFKKIQHTDKSFYMISRFCR